MKSVCIVIAIVLSLKVNSQNYFANYVIIGSSLTYLREDSIDTNYGINYGYDEYTWNINLGIRISKRFFSGLQVLNIFSSRIATKKQYYNVYGLFTQFNFLNNKTHRLFAEASLNKGNYCVCGDIPYFADNLYYAGVWYRL